MATSSNGAFRYVDIFDTYVVKTALTEPSNGEYSSYYSDDASYEECLDSQANELGTWRDFRNNPALCPIIEEDSNLYAIYMKRAITSCDLQEEINWRTYEDKAFPEIAYSLEQLGISSFCISRMETGIAFGIELAKVFGITLNYEGFVSGLTEIYNKSRNVFYNIVEDLHIHNLGIYNNNLVVIDYAGCDHLYNYDEEEGVIYA